MAANSGIHVLPSCATSGVELPDERGEELLVRGGPGNLLDLETHARVLALELGDEAAHDLAFAPEPPETECLPLRRTGPPAAGGRGERESGADQLGECSSHPPVNPARFRPVTT